MPNRPKGLGTLGARAVLRRKGQPSSDPGVPAKLKATKAASEAWGALRAGWGEEGRARSCPKPVNPEPQTFLGREDVWKTQQRQFQVDLFFEGMKAA
jgi:hypothetical protein